MDNSPEVDLCVTAVHLGRAGMRLGVAQDIERGQEDIVECRDRILRRSCCKLLS